MKNGSNANGLFGVSCVTRKSSLLSSRLSAPRMSLSGIGAGLTDAPRSTRKFWIVGFDFGSTIARLSASSAISKVGLHQQRRKLQRVLVVHEAVLGDGVRRKAARQVIVQQQQLAQRVAILRDGQPPHHAVLRRRAQAGNFQCLRDPLDHLAGGRRWSAAAGPWAACSRRAPCAVWPPIRESADPRASHRAGRRERPRYSPRRCGIPYSSARRTASQSGRSPALAVLRLSETAPVENAPSQQSPWRIATRRQTTVWREANDALRSYRRDPSQSTITFTIA